MGDRDVRLTAGAGVTKYVITEQIEGKGHKWSVLPVLKGERCER